MLPPIKTVRSRTGYSEVTIGKQISRRLDPGLYWYDIPVGYRFAMFVATGHA
jgi:hypothetical protein